MRPVSRMGPSRLGSTAGPRPGLGRRAPRSYDRGACTACPLLPRALPELLAAARELGHDDDIVAASQAGPAAIVVPKVGSAAEVRQLVAAMEAADLTGEAYRALLD